MSSLLCLRGSACSDLLRGAYSSLDALKAKRFLRAEAVLRLHSASIQARAERAKMCGFLRTAPEDRCNYRHRSAARALRAEPSEIERAGMPNRRSFLKSRASAQAAKLHADHAPQPGEGPALPTAGCLSRGSHRALSLSSPRRSQSRGSQAALHRERQAEIP